MELDEVKIYCRVDYDDDDAVIQLMLNAVLDEMQELIPTFDPENPSNRQKILICAYVKELYDNRGNTGAEARNSYGQQDALRYAVRSMLLKEMLR